jgi:hypothetical protein
VAPGTIQGQTASLETVLRQRSLSQAVDRMEGIMSGIREKARKWIDDNVPGGTILTSSGAAAAQFTKVTGYDQDKLLADWRKRKSREPCLTSCNAFTGRYSAGIGLKGNYGGFDLQAEATRVGKPEAWILSTSGRYPKYGDVLRHTAFPVDVALGFDGLTLMRTAGGQGGRSSTRTALSTRPLRSTPSDACAGLRPTIPAIFRAGSTSRS